MTECTYEFEYKLNEGGDEPMALTVDNTRVTVETIYGRATFTHEDFKRVYEAFEAALKQVEPLMGGEDKHGAIWQALKL